MMGNKKSRSALIKSSVVPVFPGLWESGFCGIVVEASEVVVVEDEESSEEGMVVAVREVFGDAVEGDDEPDDLENKPCISKRLRTFHIE